MADNLYQALEHCIELVRQGVPAEDCVARYPEHAGELEPLLLAATAPLSQLGSGMPSAARTRIQSRVLAAWDRRRSPQRRGWSFPLLVPRWAVAAVVVALVVALGGAGTVAAARSAVPGAPLYPLKQLQEEARLWLARSPQAKTVMYANLVKERAREIRELAGAGPDGPRSIAVDRLEQHVRDVSLLARQNLEAQMESGTASDRTLVGTLEAVVADQESVAAVLKKDLDRAPANSYPCLRNALQTIQDARDKVRAALEGVGRGLADTRSSQDFGDADLCPH